MSYRFWGLLGSAHEGSSTRGTSSSASPRMLHDVLRSVKTANLSTVLNALLRVPSSALGSRTVLRSLSEMARGGPCVTDAREPELRAWREEEYIPALAHVLLAICASGYPHTLPLLTEEASTTPGAATAVASLIGRLARDGKAHTAALTALASMCSGAVACDGTRDAGSTMSDREVQRALLTQLISHPRRAETLLLSFEIVDGTGSKAAPRRSLLLSWQGEPSARDTFGVSRVPLSELASADGLRVASRPSDIATVDEIRELLRHFLVAQLHLFTAACSGSHLVAAQHVSQVLPLDVCISAATNTRYAANVRAAFVRIVAAAHAPVLPGLRVATQDAAAEHDGGRGSSATPGPNEIYMKPREEMLALVDLLLREVATTLQTSIASSDTHALHYGVSAAQDASSRFYESLELVIDAVALARSLARHGHVPPAAAATTGRPDAFGVSTLSLRVQLADLLVLLASVSESSALSASLVSLQAARAAGQAASSLPPSLRSTSLVAEAAAQIVETLLLLESQSDPATASGVEMPRAASSSFLVRLLRAPNVDLAAAALRLLAWEQCSSSALPRAIAAAVKPPWRHASVVARRAWPTEEEEAAITGSLHLDPAVVPELAVLLRNIRQQGIRCLARWEMAATSRAEHEAWRDMSDHLNRLLALVVPPGESHAAEHGGSWRSARMAAARLGAVQTLSELLQVVPEPARRTLPELRVQLSQLYAVQSLAMRNLTALCDGCEANQTAVASWSCPQLVPFLASGDSFASKEGLVEEATLLVLATCAGRSDLCASLPRALLAALLRGATRDLTALHATTLEAVCTSVANCLPGGKADSGAWPHVLPTQRWIAEVFRSVVAADLAVRDHADASTASVGAPLLAWLHALEQGQSAVAARQGPGDEAAAAMSLRAEHAPLIELLGTCASGLDHVALASCRFLLPLATLARCMESTSSPPLWAALGRLLLHAHLREREEPGGSHVRLLRSSSVLRAMWSCVPQLRALVQGDGHDTTLTRVLLPCIQAFVGGRSGGARSFAASATAPQRALVAALHHALLAIARHHVAVGQSGLKFAALEGGGRLALDAALESLERCCRPLGPASQGPVSHPPEVRGGHGIRARRTDFRSLGPEGSPSSMHLTGDPVSPGSGARVLKQSKREGAHRLVPHTLSSRLVQVAAATFTTPSATRRRHPRFAGDGSSPDTPDSTEEDARALGDEPSEAAILQELRTSPSASVRALMGLCMACSKREELTFIQLLPLALRLLRSLLPQASAEVLSSSAAADMVIDLLASHAALADGAAGVAGHPSTDAASKRWPPDELAADIGRQRLEVCAALLRAGADTLRRRVETKLMQCPWLGGLCARALLEHLRQGVRAARSPLLAPARRPSASELSALREAQGGEGRATRGRLEELVRDSAGWQVRDGIWRCAVTSQLDAGLGPSVSGCADGASLGTETALAAQAAAALPAALHVCELLQLWGDTRLRGAVEWQLALGMAAEAKGATSLGRSAPPSRILGATPPRSSSARGLPSQPPAASSDDRAEATWEAAPRAPAVTTLADAAAAAVFLGEDLLRSLWHRSRSAALGALPRLSSVLSCGLILLVGGALRW